MERPINFLEAKMESLIRKRFALKIELDKVDSEIGKLDILMNRPAARLISVDLDRDSMYRKP